MFLSSGGHSCFIRDEHRVLKIWENTILCTFSIYFWDQSVYSSHTECWVYHKALKTMPFLEKYKFKQYLSTSSFKKHHFYKIKNQILELMQIHGKKIKISFL